MTTTLTLTARDRSLLRLLSWTPATAGLILLACVTFDGDPFLDERRVRERLQTLSRAGFVRAWPASQVQGGLRNYYKLTPVGFRALAGVDIPLPPRAFFGEISPALFAHTSRLADVIVHLARGCHARRIVIERFYRENELAFTAGDAQVQPDCFIRLSQGGQAFNLAFEIDQGTESVDATAVNSLREKLRIYHAYQDQLLADWRQAGKTWECPRFRTVFLTPSVKRCYHLLALARKLSLNPARHLIYAATQASFLGESDPLSIPLFLNHSGRWQALVDLHPRSPVLREPVALPAAMETSPVF